MAISGRRKAVALLERWKYFDITHRDHILCNPLDLQKLDELIGLLDLPTQARVLDIATGKAELLVRLAERAQVRGVGVDLSPYCVRDARAKARQRGVDANLAFALADGAAFDPGPDLFDLTLCVGASWVFGGHGGTLAALRDRTRPGGQVLVGEPYWRAEPPKEYLVAMQVEHDAFLTHAGNVAAGEDAGLVPLYTLVSSRDDWDRYEGLQWRAADRYAAGHPEDPDVPELLARSRHFRDAYLRYGREVMGWALYLFRR